MSRSRPPRFSRWLPAVCLFAGALTWSAAFAQEEDEGATVINTGSPLLYHVEAASQRLEMTVNTSRILTLDQKVPKAQVNNPELLDLLPLSASQIQVHAKKTGVTQINLWDEDDRIRTIDVVIFGDAQELQMTFKTVFPNASLRVIPLPDRAIITGFVDRPDDVNRIVEIARAYYPDVINAISVGGVQQVLLDVKVMEVSRTRLRTMGVDWAYLTNGEVFGQGVSGLLSTDVVGGSIIDAAGETFGLGIVEGSSQFVAAIEALRQNNLAKVLAEPKLVTVSGRPAFFNDGGEFPIIVPQSLGTVSIEYRRFGTQVDFVPIVLGNGNIRLEVRPRVSEIDLSRSVVINNTTVPGLRVREIDTGAELKAGQTLALAGLVQERIDAETRGLPWLMDIPYAGVMFRRNTETRNEVELLIMVTPHLVEAMDAHEVPPCGPGTMTDSPTDCELYGRGYIEVPRTPGGGGYMGDELPEGAFAAPPEEVMPPAESRPATGERQGSARTRRPTTTRTSSPARTRTSGTTERRGASRTDRVPARPVSTGTTGGRTTAVDRARPAREPVPAATASDGPGFIGPTGYDMDE
jgi:pilus assembly protein CpaC